jgi:hypothetical protein
LESHQLQPVLKASKEIMDGQRKDGVSRFACRFSSLLVSSVGRRHKSHGAIPPNKHIYSAFGISLTTNKNIGMRGGFGSIGLLAGVDSQVLLRSRVRTGIKLNRGTILEATQKLMKRRP